jgi:CelD/BcsL family acetyltransferase involved in cellulose biosynthesis
MTDSGRGSRKGSDHDIGSSTPLTGKVVTTRKELATYAHEWNELLSYSNANTIFLTWEWVSAWLEAVYPDAQLSVVAVRGGDGRLTAVAPFYLSDLHLLGLIRYRCLRVIGDCQSGWEYGDVIVRSGFEDVAMMSIMQELLKHNDIWDCIWVCNMAGWTGAYERFSGICRELGLYMHEWIREFSSVRLPDTYEAYLDLFSKKRRGYVKRETRRLHTSHSVELIRCNSQNELPEQLSNLFELHRKRWESVGQLGSFVRRPPMKRFYESFASVALRKGWLRLYLLKVDGFIDAAQYGYAYEGVHYALQEGYNPDSFDGIGNVLRNLVFKECIEEGLREYDFLGEHTDHKRLWRAEPRQCYHLFIGRRSLKNQLLFWKNICPIGRFIQEGRPANEGRSHE